MVATLREDADEDDNMETEEFFPYIR